MDKIQEEILKNKIIQLVKKIDKARQEYWIYNNSSISDQEYDQLFSELKAIETKYPNLKLKDSPTSKVGYTPVLGLKKLDHPVKMLSLNNVYNKEDILSFHTSILKKLNKNNVQYELELKIDGLSVDLIYQDYQLKAAITRGDGFVGEDITANISTISNLPKTIKYKYLNVTGEVVLSNSVFNRINHETTLTNEKLKKQGKTLLPLFLSPRNLAAGTVKNKSIEVVKSRKLDIFLYNVVNWETFNLKTQADILNFLKENKFSVFKAKKLVNSVDDILKYLSYWDDNYRELDYIVDGVVIKVNNLNDRLIIGDTINYPKWAVAYKFKEKSVVSKILDVEYGIGKSGKITFVAKIQPVFVNNSIISRVHLYNYKFIKDNQIAIHDNIEVIKSASVIPKIIKVIHKNSKPHQIIKEPDICPFCASKLIKHEGLIDLYCININCPGIVIDSLIHFCSQDGMNIVGLGKETIKKFYQLNLIKSISDIYELKKIDKQVILKNKELNFQEKKYSNLINEIEESKKRSFDKLLYALGIRFVGKGTIKLLIDNFLSLDKILKLSVDDLLKIKNIGLKTANSIVLFFQNDKNVKLIEFFKQNNFIFNTFKSSNIKINDSIFYQKIVLLTGKFTKHKAEIYQYLQLCGAIIAYNVSNKIDFLIVGKDPGSKLNYLKQNKKTKILTYQEFIRIKNG